MKLTRKTINDERKRVLLFFENDKSLGHKSVIKKVAEFTCRTNRVTINYDRRKLLRNLQFITDAVEQHWAETDGYSIYLNNWKEFDRSTLYFTMLHEALHGMVHRNNNELSEQTEHRMMEMIDKQLV
jgi:hypothetical protein